MSWFPGALAPRTSIVAVAGGSASGARASSDSSAAATCRKMGIASGIIRAGIPRTIRRLHRFRGIGSRSGRVPQLPPTAAPGDRIRRQGGRPAIVVRAGRLRPGRTGYPGAGRAVPRSVGRGPRHHPQTDDHRQLTHAQPLHHARPVDLDRAQADPEIVSDQLVRPVCQQPIKKPPARAD
jgi:hypothetical protein